MFDEVFDLGYNCSMAAMIVSLVYCCTKPLIFAILNQWRTSYLQSPRIV